MPVTICPITRRPRRVYPDPVTDEAASEVLEIRKSVLTTVRPGQICLNVWGVERKDVIFVMGYGIPMGKLRKMYADKNDAPLEYVRLFLGDHEVTDKETPRSLKMQNLDIVEVVVRPPDMIKLNVHGPNNDQYACTMHVAARFLDFKKINAERIGHAFEELEFSFEGKPILDEAFPAILGMEEESVIEIAVLPEPVKPVDASLKIPEYVKLVVSGKNGEKTVVRTSYEESVGSFKKSYAYRIGNPVESIVLCFKGKKARDEVTLRSLGIEDDDTIHARSASDPKLLNTIQIIVSGENDRENTFRSRVKLPLKKLKETYAAITGVTVESLTFTYNGENIQDEDTPENLGMKDDSIIEVFTENREDISFSIVGKNREEENYEVERNTKMVHIKTHFIDTIEKPIKSIKFTFGGRKIQDEDTLKSLGIKNNSIIKACIVYKR